MNTLFRLASGIGQLTAKIHPGGEWHDGFWLRMERADRSLETIYAHAGRHCDAAAVALVGGVVSMITLVACV